MTTPTREKHNVVGRPTELKAIENAIAERDNVWISGPIGVGKTAVASHFFGMVFSGADEQQLARSIAEQLKISTANQETVSVLLPRIELALQTCSDVVYVIDGYSGNAADGVVQLLVKAENLSVLVTSRLTSPNRQFESIVLPPMDPLCMAELIRLELPNETATTIDAIVGKSDGLPRLAHELIKRVRLLGGSDLETVVPDWASDLEASWMELDPSIRQLFSRLCFIETDFTVSTAASLNDDLDVIHALEQLVQRSWILRNQEQNSHVFLRQVPIGFLGNQKPNRLISSA